MFLGGSTDACAAFAAARFLKVNHIGIRIEAFFREHFVEF